MSHTYDPGENSTVGYDIAWHHSRITQLAAPFIAALSRPLHNQDIHVGMLHVVELSQTSATTPEA